MNYSRKCTEYYPKMEPQEHWFYEELSGIWFRSTIPRVRKALALSDKILIQTGFISLRELYKNLGILDFVLMTDLMYDLSDSEYSDEILGWDSYSGWYRQLFGELTPKYDENELHPLHIVISFMATPEYLSTLDYDRLGFREVYNNIIMEELGYKQNVKKSKFKHRKVGTRNYIFKED